MAALGEAIKFPSFESSKDFFRTGQGEIPQVEGERPFDPGGVVFQPQAIEGAQPAPAPQPTPQPAPEPAPQPFVQPTVQQQPGVPPAVASQFAAPPPPSQQVAPPTTQQIPLGYGTAGTGAEARLLQPFGTATQAGQEELTRFADLFRTQAGPSRTFGGIGAEQTLAGAVEGGDLGAARGLVGAQYEGPFGLDPEAAGNLMDLAGRLRVRQQALGTGGGITSTLQQQRAGTTGGEARFTAQDILDPEYRARLAEATSGIDPFAGRLQEEILGTQAFAQQRRGEEEAIAQESREYLGERGAGITTAVEAERARLQEKQTEAQDLFGKIRKAETPTEIAALLREAKEGGFIDPEVDPEGFNTQLQQTMAAAPKERQAILDKGEYASIKNVPIGTIGTGKKGRMTYLIDGQDFRDVLGKKSDKAVAFKKRQGELEEKFSAARGVSFPGGRTTGERFGEPGLGQLASPLYFGEDINLPQIKEFLDFDPGVRPSRGNVSTEQQKSQYNRIQDILGNLDRISEETTPFKAAIIMASVDDYLKAEEEALEAQKETLTGAPKKWFLQVKGERKKIRKAKRQKEYGQIGAALGGVLTAPLTQAVGQSFA